VWKHLPALAIVLVLGLILIFGLAACASSTPTPSPIEKAILGEWANSEGGKIYFYADHTGFIPGLEAGVEPIPNTQFTYYLQDETHLGIVLEGQSAVVMEIKIEGDTMTWGTIDDKEFVYNRVKAD